MTARCVRCNIDPKVRPVPAGKRMCRRCIEYGKTPEALAAHRERNRAYHERNREAVLDRGSRRRERKRLEAMEAGRPYRLDVAAMRRRVLLDWAARHGRVPGTNEAHDILREAGHRVTFGAVVPLRRVAFGMRAIERWEPSPLGHRQGWPVIPYPVPPEFRA